MRFASAIRPALAASPVKSPNMNDSTLTVVLTTNDDDALAPLTTQRAKSAIPFGGRFRLIDFALSNCLHSDLRRILVLTQSKSHSLNKHLRDGWSVFNPQLGEYITAVPPQMRSDSNAYRGSAHALAENWFLIERSGANYVLVVPGEQIYRMDYAAMVQAHHASGCDVTMACVDVPNTKASHHTRVYTNDADKVLSLQPAMHTSPETEPVEGKSLVAMGVYVFSTSALKAALFSNSTPVNGITLDVLPPLIQQDAVSVYRFGGTVGRVSRDQYWRNVPTLDDYFAANMDLLEPVPPLNLYQFGWEIRSDSSQHPPARTVSGASGNEGICVNSLMANGAVVTGGAVSRSILYPTVQVDDGAIVENCILFHGVTVGKGASLRNCIVDKGVQIPAGTKIGEQINADRARFTVTPKGVVVVPSGFEF